ncbi:conserved hypothetical protein [Rhodococcus phage E3]|uniref:hypothetical protein n=1 Tax=Rhodococcus phage E3 TaxID=1007869 RepID=UPI0002C6B003|nr:hypothetical protein M176_gp146 [Rhodococcus phage E3]AEQ21054.1 conserved hypothetical protein [Rhodococcus phage E3]
MRVSEQDTTQWLLQQAMLKSGGEPEQMFLEMLETLAGTAETRIDQGEDVGTALRVAIAELEANEGAVLPSRIIGQFLVLFVTHWQYGDTLVDELTLIERRIATEQYAEKLLELQNAARADATAEGDPSDT